MDNIFEGVKFGDKFITRDGRIAIYWFYCVKWHQLIVEDEPIASVDDDGIEEHEDEHHKDIVARYKEPIDEDKLDKLANSYIENRFNAEGMASKRDFKAGYRKAME